MKQPLATIATAVLLSLGSWLILGCAAVADSARPAPQRQPSELWCEEKYHSPCNAILGTWLPYNGARGGPAAEVSAFDTFVYRGHRLPLTPFATGPSDGTFFAYGTAGPVRGRVVYDYARRVAFYAQGCCSWGATILGSQASRPPTAVVARDLASVHTVRGARLGMTPRQISRIYGRTRLTTALNSRGHDLTAVQYRHRGGRKSGEPCEQDETFLFRAGRLVAIAIVNGC